MGEEGKTVPQFSEAIRLGAMLHPQAFGMLSGLRGLFRRHKETCAIGAALEAFPCEEVPITSGRPGAAIRGKEPATTVIVMPDEWLPVLWAVQQCPECSQIDTVYHIIAQHLNDKHRWTRERIADWVEEKEREQAQTDARREQVLSDPEVESVTV